VNFFAKKGVKEVAKKQDAHKQRGKTELGKERKGKQDEKELRGRRRGYRGRNVVAGSARSPEEEKT
jgi:hypothetical protein